MLTCRDVTESATDYMERKLSMRQSLRVRLHLLMCGFCRRYVRQLAATREALRRLPRPLPSDQQVENLLRVFRSTVDDAKDQD
jgi:predicted anti-sigma-YlaC factor YlaD